MKKLITISVLACLAQFSVEASASRISETPNSSERTMGIKVDALFISQGLIDLEFDAKLQEKLSIVFSLDGGSAILPSMFLGSAKAGLALGVGSGVRLNLSSTAFKDGWYLKPMLRFAYSNLIHTQNKLVLIPTVEGGYDWFWANGFWFSLGLAIHMPIALGINQDTNSAFVANSVFFPLLGVGLGYSF